MRKVNMWGAELLIMAAMIAINGAFAAYELGLASVSMARLERLATEKRRGALAAVRMKRNLEGSLAGVQLGITLFGAIAAATGGAGAEEQLAPAFRESLGISESLSEAIAIIAVVSPLTIVTIIVGELIPKLFALRNPEKVCLLGSPPMSAFVTAVWPVVWLLERSASIAMAVVERWFNRAEAGRSASDFALRELHSAAAMAKASRLIGEREERIIAAAAGLTGKPVRSIALAAETIRMLTADADVSRALIDAHLDLHTRFPVAERFGDPQSINGYVNFKDLVAHMRMDPSVGVLRKLVRPMPSFAADRPIADCLEELIRSRCHIALVRESIPAGRVIGMITLEDIIEELVGEIEDEFDRLPVHAVPGGNGWIVGGGLPPERFSTATGLPFPTTDGELPRHLSDWVLAHLGRPVRGGDVITLPGMRLAVRKVRRGQLLEAFVQPVMEPR